VALERIQSHFRTLDMLSDLNIITITILYYFKARFIFPNLNNIGHDLNEKHVLWQKPLQYFT